MSWAIGVASLGYNACPCRDCMEIGIDGLCWECDEAGCSDKGDTGCEVEPESFFDADEIAAAEGVAR